MGGPWRQHSMEHSTLAGATLHGSASLKPALFEEWTCTLAAQAGPPSHLALTPPSTHPALGSHIPPPCLSPCPLGPSRSGHISPGTARALTLTAPAPIPCSLTSSHYFAGAAPVLHPPWLASGLPAHFLRRPLTTPPSLHIPLPLCAPIALTAPSPHPHRPSLCRRDFARPAALTPSRLPLSPCAVPLAPPGVCFDVCAPLNLHLTRLIPSPAVQPTSAPPHTDALCIPAGRGHLRHRRRGRRHRCRASAQATRAQQRAGTQQRVEGGVRLGHG